VPDNILPPDDSSEGDADDSRPSAFDDFVNDELDFSSLDSASTTGDAERPPERRPFEGLPRPSPFSPPFRPPSAGESRFDDDQTPAFPPRPTSPFANNPGAPSSTGNRLPFSSNPFNQPQRSPLPSLEDPRWIRGVYRVRRDLRVYRLPSKISPKVVLPTASRRLDKSLRFIPNITAGWSAVHLNGEEPIIGFVDNSEVQLMPRRGLRSVWEDIALIVCLLLLVLALIANIDQLPFFSDAREAQINELESTITAQQAEIADLNATISTLRHEVQDTESRERIGERDLMGAR